MRTIKVLGFDVETNGLSPKISQTTEVGAILEEVSEGEGGTTRKVLGQVSRLLYDPSYPPQPRMIVELTGITDAMLKEEGIPPAQALEELMVLVNQCDAIMCHNAPFDKGFLLALHEKVKSAPFPEKEFICSLRDIHYPEKFKCKKLAHLALDHGVKMDHRDMHRATVDVEVMFDLVLENYDIFELAGYAKEPKVTLKIDIPKPWNDGEKGKTVAVANNYSWNKEKNAWLKTVSAKAVEAEQRAVQGYRVSVLV